VSGVRGTDGYCPWQDLASREHLTFVVARLPVADGWYLHDVPGIVLDDRLTRVQRRCVLAHELAHIDLGHYQQVAGNGPGTGRLARRNEAAADHLAAGRLLPLARLAEWMPFASSWAEAADLLDVTERLLTVRLRRLSPAERQRLDRLEEAVANVA
jgi:Zn-dependent peptidase ImmA (M78 family)